MTLIYITEKPTDVKTTLINLTSCKYASLDPSRITNIKVDENKLMCKVYPLGYFPGGVSGLPEKQVTTLVRLDNFLEFSKITDDEIIHTKEKDFLNTLFFSRRVSGWKSSIPLTKEGNVRGYYIKGCVFLPSETDKARALFLTSVYIDAIKDRTAFKNIISLVRSGKPVTLTGADEDVLKVIKKYIETKIDSCTK